MMHLGIVLQRLKNCSDFPVGGAVINDTLSNFEGPKLLQHQPHSEETLKNMLFFFINSITTWSKSNCLVFIDAVSYVLSCAGQVFKPNSASSHPGLIV